MEKEYEILGCFPGGFTLTAFLKSLYGVVNTTAQLHSRKLEACSNPTRGVLDTHDGEYL